jgi:hypothetical protein
LKVLGYRTEIIEFIAGDHTPRNLMIRAFKNNNDSTSTKSLKTQRAQDRSHDLEDLDKMIAEWRIAPKLMELLREELEQARSGAGLS